MFIIIFCTLSEEDKDLVNWIFNGNHEKLYYISMRMLRNETDAQDAVAQTFLKVIEHIEKIGKLPKAQIVPYCVVITKHVAADMLRKKKQEFPADTVEFFVCQEEADAESRFFEKANTQTLLSVLRQLPDEDRDLIHLRYACDLGYREIARLFEIGEDAAKKRGQRVLKKLRELYEKEEGSYGRRG